jgi:hypothetical protein
LAQSRPYEGLLFSVPLLISLAVWFLRGRGFSRKIALRNVAPPLVAALFILVAGSAYYNWRVTGHALLMPYSLHQKIYGTPAPFFFGSAISDASGIHAPKDIADVFRWQIDAYRERSWMWKRNAF